MAYRGDGQTMKMKIGGCRCHGTTRAWVCIQVSIHLSVTMVFLGACEVGILQVILQMQDEKIPRL